MSKETTSEKIDGMGAVLTKKGTAFSRLGAPRPARCRCRQFQRLEREKKRTRIRRQRLLVRICEQG